MIHSNGVGFCYDTDEGPRHALEDVTLHIKEGEFIAILGQNGCGKSTFARLCNALLSPQEGELAVAGIDVKNTDLLYELRRLCGMVFQNPDNQFVSDVVSEDVAFGPENYQIPQDEIDKRVKAALHQVALDGFETRAPHTLSGGQKQRLAIAGVLAISPKVIIFDESTAMLDPVCRREVLAMMQKLQTLGHTILMITHYVEEAVLADRVAIMQHGRVLALGTPQDILTDEALLKGANLLPPASVRLYHDLARWGVQLPFCPLDAAALAEAVCQLR